MDLDAVDPGDQRVGARLGRGGEPAAASIAAAAVATSAQRARPGRAETDR